MKSLLLIVTALFIFFSCKHSASDLSKKYALTSLKFELDFMPNHMHSDVYYDKATGEELIYFGDLMTAKQIAFFDFEGNEKFRVKLDSLIYNKGEIENIHIIAKDSILCLMKRQNLLVLVNNNGTKMTELFLDHPFQDTILMEFDKSIFAKLSHDSLKKHFVFRL